MAREPGLALREPVASLPEPVRQTDCPPPVLAWPARVPQGPDRRTGYRCSEQALLALGWVLSLPARVSSRLEPAHQRGCPPQEPEPEPLELARLEPVPHQTDRPLPEQVSPELASPVSVLPEPVSPELGLREPDRQMDCRYSARGLPEPEWSEPPSSERATQQAASPELPQMDHPQLLPGPELLVPVLRMPRQTDRSPEQGPASLEPASPEPVPPQTDRRSERWLAELAQESGAG